MSNSWESGRGPVEHLDDAVLARLLDGEESVPDRQRWESHLRQCVSCETELTDLRANSRRLRDVLKVSDVDVPTMVMPLTVARRSAVSWRRLVPIAALVAFLVLLAISPTRAWIVTSIRTAASGLFDRAETSNPNSTVTPVDTTPTNEVRVGVPLSGDMLNIRLASRQSSGEMTIEVISGTSAFAEVVDGDVEELVVSDGVFIRNEVRSHSSYRIGVPASVSTVTLQVANEAERRFTVRSTGALWVVELGPIANE